MNGNRQPPCLNGRQAWQAANSPDSFTFTIDCDWVPGSHVGLELLLACCDRAHLQGDDLLRRPLRGSLSGSGPETVTNAGTSSARTDGLTGGWKRTKTSASASYEQQRRWIRRATDAVEKAAGIRPVVFRAPNLSISETTLRALEDEGYRYDSSVPPGDSTWDSDGSTT